MKLNGDKLEKLRIKKGLTQRALGEKCVPTISANQLSDYRHGRKFPKIETVKIIAKGLGCSLEDIVDSSEGDNGSD